MSSRLGAGSYLNTPVNKAIRDYNSEKYRRYGKTVRGASEYGIMDINPVNYETYKMHSPKKMITAVIVVIIVLLIIIIIGYIFHLLKTGSKKDPTYFEQFKAWGGENEDEYVDDFEDDEYVDDFELDPETDNTISSVPMSTVPPVSNTISSVPMSNTSTNSTPQSSYSSTTPMSTPMSTNSSIPVSSVSTSSTIGTSTLASSTSSSIPMSSSTYTPSTIPSPAVTPATTTSNPVDITKMSMDGESDLWSMFLRGGSDVCPKCGKKPCECII